MNEEYLLPQAASEIAQAINKALSSVQTVNGAQPDKNGNVSIALPAVLYTSQDLTPEEKEQARANTGAVSAAEVTAIIDSKLSSITNAEEVAY